MENKKTVTMKQLIKEAKQMAASDGCYDNYKEALDDLIEAAENDGYTIVKK